MIVDDEFRAVFQGLGGAANIANCSEDDVVLSLRQSLQGAPSVQSVAGCFAGLLGDPLHSKALRCVIAAVGAESYQVWPDYVASWFAAPAGTDVVLIAGTGSVVCSYSGGEVVKSGGGGFILGDQGSAFDVGRTALRLVCDSLESYGPSPALLDQLEESFGTSDLVALPGTLATIPSYVSKIAALAPTIGCDFSDFDYARIAISHASANLAELLKRHVDFHLGSKQSIRVALTGGLWSAHQVYFESFQAQIELLSGSDLNGSKFRQYDVEQLTTQPVYGAAQLARKLFHGN